MKSLEKSDQEERLQCLQSYQVLYTQPEPDYDKITEFISRLCKAPIALISFIDSERQWFKSRVGTLLESTALSDSFCVHTIQANRVLVVEDAIQDERFMKNILVQGEFGVRFYAGAPIVSEDGFPLGALCILDKNPRKIMDFEEQALVLMAAQVSTLLELRRKKALNDLLQANLSYHSKLNSLGEMAAGVAHEINNPLSVILGRSALLMRQAKLGELDAEYVMKTAEKIKETAERVAKIVKGLKSLSAQGSETPFERAVLKDLVEDTLSYCRDRFETAGVRLEVNFHIPDGFYLECRPVQISQVLVNLLNNAFDAVAALSERWVNLSVEMVNGNLEMRVSDSGNGIALQLSRKIFKTFFTTKGPGKGMGLGLSISQKIMAAHRGRIYYDEKSKHTCFVIEIPLVS